MQIWSPDEVSSAVAALRAGRLVGMPTETVYGLAGNALEAQVVASIFAAKQRPTFDPLIVHAATAGAALGMAAGVPEEAGVLADRFWPGPLTLVLPRDPSLPELLSAGLDTVAFRVPQHPVARRLIEECGFPLAAPSANRFGGISPTRADHVVAELSDQPAVAGVIDAGPCAFGLESTVVGFPQPGRAVVYRLGGLTVEQLREVLDDLEVVRAFDAVDDPTLARRGEQSPGMLARHYAPRTGLILLDEGEMLPEHHRGKSTAHLGLEDLSESGCLVEAAANLFGRLRMIDEGGFDLIVARRVPDEGLGRAINDRLYRAAVEKS
ncbi:MAG: L-threonylcarbamoyladenylate synthase [Phycisphaerae bacterium]